MAALLLPALAYANGASETFTRTSLLLILMITLADICGISVAVAGVVLPIVLGLGTCAALGFATGLESWFVGAMLAATSVGITARILDENGLLKTRSAEVILGAAVIDDVLGIMLLGGSGQYCRDRRSGAVGYGVDCHEGAVVFCRGTTDRAKIDAGCGAYCIP
ncbi:MAG: hypothetical protein DRQ98_05880 [Gammaproteobacteria bacterium]|nr:MAG: hypothetical protein DRQ98_05880 [Gammaproteobacteria bacterium]